MPRCAALEGDQDLDQGAERRGAPELRQLHQGGLTALAALFAIVAALDLARAYLGASLRPWQWLAGLALVGALCRTLGRRGFSRRQLLPVAALALCLLPTYVDHARSIGSDGVHYYVYLRSALFDRDLDLANDYELLGVSPGPNLWSVGPALLWSPLVVVVFLCTQAQRLFGGAAPSGVEPAYQAAVCLATLLYGSLGLFLLQDTLRRFAGAWVGFWTTLLCWVGTPLRFYLSVVPSMAHGLEFFAAVLVLRASLALRERPEARPAMAAGGACGLAFLVRWQDVLLAGLPGLLLAWSLREPAQRRRRVQALAWFALTLVVVALPQMAAWQSMFGVPLLVPQERAFGGSFLRPAQPELGATLVSARGGLFSSHPVLLLACGGLAWLAGRAPLYVAAALPVLLAGWYANASVFDWWQVRRFTGLVPLLAPGLAAALAPLARAGWPLLGLITFLALRYDLAVDRLRSGPGQPAPVRGVIAELSDGLAGEAYALLERPAPGAAVALLGAYTGERLEAPASEIDLARDPLVLRLPRSARHLSGVEVEDGLACRWVSDDTRATLFLPLDWAGEAFVRVKAHPLETKEPLSMELLWNSRPLGTRTLQPGWRDYRFHVPAGALRRGTNTLVLQFDRAPIYRRVRGIGPREVRPAALASIGLERGSGAPE